MDTINFGALKFSLISSNSESFISMEIHLSRVPTGFDS